MIKEKYIVYGMIGLLLLTTIFDFYTAFTSPIFSLGETNPLVLLFGNAIILTIVAIGLTSYIIWKLKTQISLMGIYIFVLATIYLSLGHVVGGVTNMISTNEYYDNPQQVVQELREVTVSDKALIYAGVVFVFLILPVIVSIFAFSITRSLYIQRGDKRLKVIDNIQQLAKKLLEG